MDSDHHPLCVRGNNKRERGRERGIRRRGNWNEVDREQFQEKLEMMEEGKDKLQEEIETEILKIRKIIAEREEKRMNNNRRGRIYALNYLINRQLGKEKGSKMTVIFIDLKAAFDLVDKEMLIKTMRARGVKEELVDRSGGVKLKVE